MQNHSDLITKDTLTALLQQQEDLSISIFLPTLRAGKEIQQNVIRFKNLLTRAEEQAESLGIRTPRRRGIFEPARQFLEETPFWQHQSDGLSFFLTPNLLRYYRLPYQVSSVSVVSKTFHVKPLFPLFSEDTTFYLLALSQKQVRLFQATLYDVRQLELEDMPGSLEEMLADEEREKEVQMHSGDRVGNTRDKGSAVFHGQGAGSDEANAKRLQFFHQVDRSVQTHLQGQQAPLVLAGVEALFPLYRRANTYPHLLDQGVQGNPDGLSAKQLHAQAVEIVRPVLLKNWNEDEARYRQLAANGGGKTSQRLREILSAAYYGRVETLFAAVGVQQWGTFDEKTDTAHLHDEQNPGDGDLLNAAAVQTLQHGGKVYAVPPTDIPATGTIAAILRH